MTRFKAEEPTGGAAAMDETTDRLEIDVIVPVYNAAETLHETLQSAMNQEWPVQEAELPVPRVYVCCFNDYSTDNSWNVLQECAKTIHSKGNVPCEILIQDTTEKISRGAGYARNKAVGIRKGRTTPGSLLCWLDSDDIMHPRRLFHQVHHLMGFGTPNQAIVGCRFDRIPQDSTLHYTTWANSLSNERIRLEQFREVTIIQPTWMMSRSRFEALGGYLEAPLDNDLSYDDARLVHRSETAQTLRVAEDLRLFHEHLARSGEIQVCPVDVPLLSYRHRVGQSQSSNTPRKLLLQLRVVAFERRILPEWKGGFVIWGAGRDGKDFYKALTPERREQVVCFLDVDDNKIERGYYEFESIKVPIVHFSLAVRDGELREKLYGEWKSGTNGAVNFGKIRKGRDEPFSKSTKKQKLERRDPGASLVDPANLATLPAVVCVAMYRTNGALESNVAQIGRTEGEDLWHFS